MYDAVHVFLFVLTRLQELMGNGPNFSCICDFSRQITPFPGVVCCTFPGNQEIMTPARDNLGVSFPPPEKKEEEEEEEEEVFLLLWFPLKPQKHPQKKKKDRPIFPRRQFPSDLLQAQRWAAGALDTPIQPTSRPTRGRC